MATIRRNIEEWCPVRGYPHYEVSSLGRVRRRGERRLRRLQTIDGYHYVALRRQGDKQRGFRVHRLVWEAHVGPIGSRFQIDHIDCNRRNNALSNLRMVTGARNIQHSVKMGRRRPEMYSRSGEKAATAKLTNRDVRRIRKLCAAGANQTKLAAEYGVSNGSISAIHTRRTWRHI